MFNKAEYIHNQQKCEKLNLEGERDQFVKFELEAVTRMLEKQIGLSQRCDDI